MKIIFIDVENIGLKELENLETSILDKVFVFSKIESVKIYCEKMLYHFVSDYPDGANQADFCIIAYLSRILVNLTKKEKTAIEFELYTNDVNLSQAFTNQCDLFSAKSAIIKTRIASTFSPITSAESVPYESEFLSALSTPKTVVELKEILNISQSSFTRVMNHLIKNNKIERESENQKQWVKG